MYDFLVEDGTGLPNATSYVYPEDVEDYANFVGDTTWQDLSIEEQERQCMITSMFVDNLLLWNGELLNEDQALNFPREDFRDSNGRLVTGVPKPIKQAVMQLAIASIEQDLDANPVRLKSQGFGSSREEYFGEYVEDDAGILNIKTMLATLGYGRSGTTIIEVTRRLV